MAAKERASSIWMFLTRFTNGWCTVLLTTITVIWGNNLGENWQAAYSCTISTFNVSRHDLQDLCSYFMRTTLTVWTPGILLYSDSSCEGGKKNSYSEINMSGHYFQNSSHTSLNQQNHKKHMKTLKGSNSLRKGNNYPVVKTYRVHNSLGNLLKP